MIIRKYTDKITISHNAASMGGSQILLEEGEVMSVDDLIKYNNDLVAVMIYALSSIILIAP